MGRPLDLLASEGPSPLVDDESVLSADAPNFGNPPSLIVGRLAAKAYLEYFVELFAVLDLLI
jgi:hypothetical protein